jgi:hypothetical protein
MQPDNAAVLAHRTAQALQVVARSPCDRVPWLPSLSVALAEVIAAFDLSRRNLPRELALGVDRGMEPVLGAKQAIHSGLIGDYDVAHRGLALFAVVFAIS